MKPKHITLSAAKGQPSNLWVGKSGRKYRHLVDAKRDKAELAYIDEKGVIVPTSTTSGAGTSSTTTATSSGTGSGSTSSASAGSAVSSVKSNHIFTILVLLVIGLVLYKIIK